MRPNWHNAVNLRVDPDNRLVADTLEADWNNKLLALVWAPHWCDAEGTVTPAWI